MKFKSIIQTAVAWLALAFLSGLPAFAQEHKHEAQPQDPAPLKLSTELVSLSVTVTDRKGQAVVGLKREDLKVYKNGVEQPVNFFSTEEMPVCWGIVLDRSAIMLGMIDDVYRAAVHVVDEGAEEDEAFIVTFNKKVELVTDFLSGVRPCHLPLVPVKNFITY